MGSFRTILQSTKLQDYILNVSTLPREHEELKALREATYKKLGQKAMMNVPADEGQFLSMLLKLMNAKKTLEIGVFTGYSLLVTALALPHDGHVTAIDISREDYEIGLPFIKNANVEHKINFIHSDAMLVIDDLLPKMRNGATEPFDFIFIDANKEVYIKYHDKVIELVRIGGVIAYDNTLWFGFVAEEDESEVDEGFRAGTKALKLLNQYLAADARVEICQLSVGDGITLCRRVV